jgi:hypothetical protein
MRRSGYAIAISICWPWQTQGRGVYGGGTGVGRLYLGDWTGDAGTAIGTGSRASHGPGGWAERQGITQRVGQGLKQTQTQSVGGGFKHEPPCTECSAGNEGESLKTL